MDFQDDKKDNIELIIEKILHIQGLTFRLISLQQVSTQIGQISYGLHTEKDEAHVIFGGFQFTTKYNASSGLPIYNSSNGISKIKVYNMEIYQDGGEKDNLILTQRSLLKFHRRLGHMNF